MKKINFLILPMLVSLLSCTVNVTNPAGGTTTTTPKGDSTASSVSKDGFDSKNGLNADKTKMLDRRDKSVYAVAKIGAQYWMAENLNFETKASVKNKAANAKNHGRAYDWNNLMAGASSSDKTPSGVQGICPQGWHVPSDGEWMALEVSLGLDAKVAKEFGWHDGDQGDQLKSTSGWTDGKNGTGSSGFNALPAGYFAGAFASIGDQAHFWTSTAHADLVKQADQAWSRILSYDKTGVERSFHPKGQSYNLRCLAD